MDRREAMIGEAGEVDRTGRGIKEGRAEAAGTVVLADATGAPVAVVFVLQALGVHDDDSLRDASREMRLS